VMQRQ